MLLTDSHLHFDSFAARGEVEEVLERAGDAGVGRMVAIGGSAAANELAACLAAAHPAAVWAAVGFDRDQATLDPDIEGLGDLAGRPGVVAVGETGLDYHYSPDTAGAQKELFTEMLRFSRERALPVVVHSREARADTLDLLAAHAREWPVAGSAPGVLHCFTENMAFARALLDLGYLISFSGIVTFKNADALREVAAAVPDDRLMIETDAPYLAPVPRRGKRNEPAYVRYVAEALAEVRGCSLEHVAEVTGRNADRLFAADGEKRDHHGSEKTADEEKRGSPRIRLR
jgi:TatD DNase family protein